MNNNVVVGLDGLFDALLDHMLENLRKRLKNKIYAKLGNDRTLDARTAGICLAIIDNVIDDMMEDKEE